MRQCGIRYELAEGYQRIVDKHFIIKPRAEFEVCDDTLEFGLSTYINYLFHMFRHKDDFIPWCSLVTSNYSKLLFILF